MTSGTTLCRTAIAHAALLALCGAATAQQSVTTPGSAEPTAERALAPVTVTSGAEQQNPPAPVTGFVAKRALSATKTDPPLIETPQAISVITRDQIVEAVWPEAASEGVSEQAIDALVRRLRERIEECDDEFRYIVTVRGHGFRLENR